MRRVVASADLSNVGSWRVMEKCGMVLARRFFGPRPDDPDGDILEAVEYMLDRDDWERQSGPSGAMPGNS